MRDLRQVVRRGTRLLAAFLPITIVAMLALSLVSYHHADAIVREQLERRMTDILRDIHSEISHKLDLHKRIATAWQAILRA
ncbi:hypothetical protein HM1_2120 [Heliomicrobium modesticaldum Ice1]|uniref:Uncharacterized protein n=1 Tax=Heliobacterium modesticaldum (strain ATCC 51547 / Ice1) TaxID=498761 RepID=B0TGR6_HELMI|nr:hypothetical protein HM1_2120 [Heliomicrobium modesticaldum Ice1]